MTILKSQSETVHVVNLTGGKDSTAMALLLKERKPQDYVYTYAITGAELPETLDFLAKLEKIIGKIQFLFPRTYEERLIRKQYFFPSARYRWCTELLKIRPVNAAIGHRRHILYLGYSIFHKPPIYRRQYKNRVYSYPLRKWGIEDSQKILDRYGLRNEAYNYMPNHNCFCCFQNSFSTMMKIFRAYPGLWKKMYTWKMEAMKCPNEKYRSRGPWYWKKESFDDLIDFLGIPDDEKKTYIV